MGKSAAFKARMHQKMMTEKKKKEKDILTIQYSDFLDFIGQYKKDFPNASANEILNAWNKYKTK